MRTPLVFDIKRASTNDGPGIRTVIFFKGCNLNCAWCHNPESKRAHAEMAFFADKCIGCGECKSACAKGNDGCIICGECTEVCPAGARRLYGKEYSVPELFDIIKADKAYFDATGGGATFSGGECMLYPEFVRDLARLCKENGISVAIDTAGCVPFSSFETIMPFADLFLFDIKALDTKLHEKGTGKPNDLILENLNLLIKANKSVQIRVPVIPSFNDGEEVERIKEFCEQRNLPVELLPYHEFGKDKKRALESFSSL